VDRAAAFDALLNRLMESAAKEKLEAVTASRTQAAAEAAATSEPEVPAETVAASPAIFEAVAEEPILAQAQEPAPVAQHLAPKSRWNVEPEPPQAIAQPAAPVAVTPIEIAVPRKQASVLPPEKTAAAVPSEPDVEPAQRQRRRFEEYAFHWNDPGTGDLAILPPHSPGQYGKGSRRRR